MSGGPNGSLPNSEDAEKGVLCSLLLAPGEVHKLCASRLPKEAFYIEAHQIIYELVEEWDKPDTKVDFIWLRDRLRKQNQLEEIGGPQCLNELYCFVPTATNASYYIRILLEKYQLRRLALLCRKTDADCCEHYAEAHPLIEDFEREMQDLARYGNGANLKLEHRLSGRNILDFLDMAIDPETNLAGNRFLTKGSGLFIISPSGHGKSSMSIQFLISFAIGRVVFGIKPPRPLRIMCIQSEDDDAETKKFAQVIRKMNLTAAERELLKQNTRFEYRNDLNGTAFLNALDCFLSEWPADVVIINPLTGFFLGDLKNEEKVAEFLRAGINPLLTKHGCAAIIVHHTPKTNFTKLENMQWYDWMYAMSGCASLTNWARAVLVLAPSKVPGTYRLIAAKRFDEIQWTEREYWYSHSRETIVVAGEDTELIEWVPSSAIQIGSAKPIPKGQKQNTTYQTIWQKMSALEWCTKEEFREWAKEQFGTGRDRAYEILTLLCDKGLLEMSSEDRSGTNPLKRYRKVSKTAQINDSRAKGDE